LIQVQVHFGVTPKTHLAPQKTAAAEEAAVVVASGASAWQVVSAVLPALRPPPLHRRLVDFLNSGKESNREARSACTRPYHLRANPLCFCVLRSAIACCGCLVSAVVSFPTAQQAIPVNCHLSSCRWQTNPGSSVALITGNTLLPANPPLLPLPASLCALQRRVHECGVDVDDVRASRQSVLCFDARFSLCARSLFAQINAGRCSFDTFVHDPVSDERKNQSCEPGIKMVT